MKAGLNSALPWIHAMGSLEWSFLGMLRTFFFIIFSDTLYFNQGEREFSGPTST